jgi:hypothetical protein
LHSPPVARLRFGSLPVLCQGIAEVKVGLGMVRLDLQDAPEASDGFGKPALVVAGLAKVVVGVGVSRLIYIQTRLSYHDPK